MDKGCSYPAARAKALMELLGEDARCYISRPNNILAVEYMKAIKRQGSPIVPLCIERAGSSYSDTVLSGEFASAAALRKEIAANGIDGKARQYMPAGSFLPLTDMDTYSRMILLRLRTMGKEEIEKIGEVTEGLENRIKKAADNSFDIDSLVLNIKSKRFTYTRIKRILLYCLLGITKDILQDANKGGYPLYARVLGFKKDSEMLVSLVSARSHIPVLAKSSGFRDSKMLDFDIMATDVYALLNKKILPAGQDFTKRLVVI
jgi:predicted nucleotidyltransferase